MNIKRIGMDIAKQVFQIHGVDRFEKVLVRKQLRRAQVLEFFKNIAPCLIGIEACGSSHYWARELSQLGHQVKLIPAQFVKPFVKGGKNDANDAEAICEAVSRANMRFVAIKSVEQQVAQAEHRIRSRLVRARTALSNEIRGLLSEFGIVIAPGISQIRQALPVLLEDKELQLNARLKVLLAELASELRQIDDCLVQHEQRLKAAVKEDERMKRLMDIEGIGPISASALVAAVGDATHFASGRDMAAWLGLVPDQHSSGGKERLGHISKRGDTYLRTLLIHGARAVLNHCEHKEDKRSVWVNQLVKRRNRNIATVALANKNARIAWAVLSRKEAYRGSGGVIASHEAK
ncbi:IS110 family transposase [Undibacterium pigrum]|uniref:Transposase n=1 Tax=Undibacterium pigrum TaxID=401470 RepID=A0A318J3C9_9BURK|nr:IS110 family transposase [Undibacterium pigrum]PXX33084.1 transposase [Undibacterium pigrum]